MATYKCLQSGQTVTFTAEHDIKSMEGHQGYIRIDQENQSEKPVILAIPTKKLGRPKKVVNV